MVARAGGYYGAPLCGERGVTQGNPLSPTIFNVVVDAVVFHWESLVAQKQGEDSSGDKGDRAQTAGRKIWEQDGGQQLAEEGHQRLMVKAELFNTNDGIVAYTDPEWIQLAFCTLTGLFDQVGIQTNIRNIAGMVCRPVRAAEVQEDKAYTQRMIGGGLSLKERQREWVL